MRKVEIIPAILPKDYEELEGRISDITGLVKTVQVDVCDGQFTPGPSWPYKKEDESFKKIISESDGLPGWESLDYEIDLMVNNPIEVVQDWVSAGAVRLVIHAESRGDIRETILQIKDQVEVGLALNEETPLSEVSKYIDIFTAQPLEYEEKKNGFFVQLMGIDNIGFQGQQFDERVIGRTKELRKMYPDLIISIDGGVSLSNAKKLVEAGANRLVVGSAIFNSDNIYEAVSKLKAEVRV